MRVFPPPAITSSRAVTSNRLTFAIGVVFIYDWLLTLPIEFAEVWTQKVTCANFFYLCTRYLNWIFWVLSIYQLFAYTNPSDSAGLWAEYKVCPQLYMTSSIIGILGRLTSMGLFALRTWAIYQANIFVLIFLVLIAFGFFILSVLSLLNLTNLADIPGGFGFEPEAEKWVGFCGLVQRNTLSTSWYPTLVWGSLLFSAIVFFLTLYKTVGAFRTAKSVGIKRSFHLYLLRDGSMYYLAVVCLDIAFLAAAFNERLDPDTLSSLASVNAAIETLLSCRLILNLRRRSHMQPGHSISFGQVSTFAAQNFTQNVILGNIGAPLRDADEEWEDFMEDINGSHERDVLWQIGSTTFDLNNAV